MRERTEVKHGAPLRPWLAQLPSLLLLHSPISWGVSQGWGASVFILKAPTAPFQPRALKCKDKRGGWQPDFQKLL